MAFITKIDLSDNRQAYQKAGSVLTLSGSTHILENLTASTVTINNGTAVPGYVWTAVDANGNADWQASSGGTTGTGVSYLSGLSDTNIVNPVNGDSLIFSGGTWINLSGSTDLTNYYTKSETSSLFTDISSFTGHTGDTSIHHTLGELGLLYADISSFTGHTGDTSIHHTLGELGLLYTDITSFSGHTGDTSIHHTLSELNSIYALTGTTYWQRTGTTLSPTTANDNIDIGSGAFYGGHIGIGVTGSTPMLHVKKGGTLTGFSPTTLAVFQNDDLGASAYISILCYDSAQAAINFGSNTQEVVGQIQYNKTVTAEDSMDFLTMGDKKFGLEPLSNKTYQKLGWLADTGFTYFQGGSQVDDLILTLPTTVPGNIMDPPNTTNKPLIGIATGIAGDAILDWNDQALTTTSDVGFNSLSANTIYSGLTNINDMFVHLTGDETIAGNKTFSDSVIITGDLTVNGTATTINTQTILAEDNMIVINYGEVGSGVTSVVSGIQVDRGLFNPYLFIFNEASGYFEVGSTGNTQPVATRETTPIASGITYWDSVNKRLVTTTNLIYTDGTELFTNADINITAGKKYKINGIALTAADVGALANSLLGSTTTVLHGNPGGALTFGPVVELDISLTPGSTVNNSSNTTHGFCPSLPNSSEYYLNGQGNWAVPSGTTNSYISITFSAQTGVTIIHNFGAYPVVQIIDDIGAVIIPTSIINNTTTDFSIVFATSTTGTVIATLGGPQAQSVKIITSNYTATTSDIIIQVTGIGSIITLYSAVGNGGKQLKIDNNSTGNITIMSLGGTIQSQTSQLIPNDSCMDVYSDNANWRFT